MNAFSRLLANKKRIFTTYKQNLSDDPRCKVNYEAPWAKNVYWMVCLEVNNYDEDERDKLILRLRQENIDSRPYFYPVSDMPMYEKEIRQLHSKVYKRGINLPSYCNLQNDTIEYICKKLKESI